MQRRYLVVLPLITRPTGGVNVLLWMIEVLRAAGHDIVPLWGSRDVALAFRPFAGPQLYSPDLARLFRRGYGSRGWRQRVRFAFETFWRRLVRRRSRAISTSDWQPRSGDVLILPEFMYPELSSLFQDHPCILFVQGYMVLLNAMLRSQKWKGGQAERFVAVIASSVACAKSAEAVFGTGWLDFPLPVCRPSLTFNPEKKLQIALMPRKRRNEVQVIEKLIAMHPELCDIPIATIDAVSEEAAHGIMRESLLFLSFSEMEGFGLPPAEAMATGSLVIGYTGVGGEEYFNSETGFPIADGDVIGFIEVLADVVRRWRSNPADLDRKRKYASDFVWQTYSEEGAKAVLLSLWPEVANRLDASYGQ